MALRITKPAFKRLSGATAVAAAFSMLATPAAAVELPRASKAEAYDADAGNAERNRRWRHDRDDIDTGDVLTGVLILGGLAAIASAASKKREREREREPIYYPDRETRGVSGYDSRTESRGLDRAVDMCVSEVERRSERVDSVDSASRSGDGWYVGGALAGGSPYSCWIGNDGRISDVEIGGAYEAGYEEPLDEEWSDDDYARAREAQGGPPPLPEDYEGADGDGRYETARAPDFE